MTQLANILKNRETPYSLKVSEKSAQVISEEMLHQHTTLVSLVFKEYVIASIETGATIDAIIFPIGTYDWNNAYTEYTKNITTIDITNNSYYNEVLLFFEENGLSIDVTHTPKLTLKLKYI